MVYYNTLDLDKIDKTELERILAKIKSLQCCLGVSYKDSSTKGYHVRIDCAKKCNDCRFVFDDTNRFAIDFKKDDKFQNITFQEKEFFRGNTTSIKNYCERCIKYSNMVTLTKKTLTLKQVGEKLRIGQIPFEPILVHLGYIYLECPKCGWFKFVKIENSYHLDVVEK